MLWQLFWTFFKLGFVSFGGGYAMIPLIEREAVLHGWMSALEFTDSVAVAGMSPGPIGTNIAIMIGYHTDGVSGAIAATAGIVLPSLLLVIAASVFFYKFHKHRYVRMVFYGLRPAVTSLIVYGAIRFASNNGLVAALPTQTALGLAIFAGAMYALAARKLHPLAVLALSGVVGVAVYG